MGPYPRIPGATSGKAVACLPVEWRGGVMLYETIVLQHGGLSTASSALHIAGPFPQVSVDQDEAGPRT